MGSKTLNTRIRQRLDTTTNWTTNNTILANGELGLERTTSGNIKIKVGDGVHTWSQLSYLITGEADNSNSNSNIEYSNILFEKYRKTITSSQYDEANDTISNYTVSETDFAPITDTVFINICKDSINQYYLNSFDLPLTQTEFGQEMAEELIGSESGITNIYNLSNNFDISTFTPIDSNEDFYLINLFEFDTIYYYQFVTNLSIANAPINWIIYQLNPNLIVENKVQSNSKNLITSGAVQRAINNFISGTITTNITENSTAIPTAGAVYSAISSLPSGGGGGGSYTAGDGIKIANGTISSSYGTNIWVNTQLNYSTQTVSAMPWEIDNLISEIGVNYGHFFIPDQYIDFIEKPFTITFKESDTAISSINITLSTSTLWENTEHEKTNLNFAAGNIYFAQAISAMIDEWEDSNSIDALQDENNPISTSDWWMITYDTSNSQHFLTLIAHEDIMPLTIDEFTISIQTQILQKIPSNALSASNGIIIGDNATIKLDYSSTKHIPYEALNGTGNTDAGLLNPAAHHPAEAIVLGNNNTYYTKNNKLLVIGNNNDLDNNINYSSQHPSLVIGNSLLDNAKGQDSPLVLIGESNNTQINNSVSNGTPYLVIGKGNSSNILEITSTGININGNLYINGTSINSGLDENSLASYLSSNNYVTTSDLSGYVTTSDLSGYVTTSDLNSYVTTSYLSNNNYVTTSDLSGYVTTSDLNSYVSTTRTINGIALNSNITLTASDVGSIPTSAKTTSITSSSTDQEIPTAKAVWDLLEVFIDEVLGGNY